MTLPESLSARRWRATFAGCSGPRRPTGRSHGMHATIRGARRSWSTSGTKSSRWCAVRARLSADFERFRRELPRDFAGYVRQAYRIDLTARYLGYDLPHPFGKGSGQLALNVDQLETDRA